MSLKYYDEQKFRKKDGMPYGFTEPAYEDTREAQFEAWQNNRQQSSVYSNNDNSNYNSNALPISELRKAKNDPNIERVYQQVYSNKQNEYSKKAVELAQDRANKTNAGNNRTTEYKQPASKSVFGGNSITFDATKQGMNTASNGADIDYSAINEKATENEKVWKGLNSGRSNISTEESVENATKALSGLTDDQLDILEEYVKSSDQKEQLTFSHVLNAMGGYIESGKDIQEASDKQQSLKEQFIGDSQMSDEDFDKLVEYATYLSHDKAAKTLKSKIKNSSGVTKAALSAGDVVLFPLTSMMNLGDRIVHGKPLNDDLGRDYHNFYNALGDISSYTENAVLEDADTIENPFMRSAAKFGYQTIMASGKSYTAAMSGDVGLLFFGTSAYTDGVRDAEERGLTDAQAQLYGITSGLTEMATEKIPQDHLKDLIFGGKASKEAQKGLKESLKEIAIQMAEEGNEEAVNDVVNSIADAFIAGDKSNDYMAYQKYLDSGMSENDALLQVTKDKIAEISYDYAVGAASGGISAGTAIGTRKLTDASTGKKIVNDTNLNTDIINNSKSADYISANREDYNSDDAYNNAIATRQNIISAAEQASQGKKVSSKEARAITEGMRQAYSDMDARSRVVFEAQQNAARQNAEIAAIDRVNNATTATEVESIKEKYANNENIVAAAEEKKAQMVESGQATADDFTNAITPLKAHEMAKQGEEIAAEELEQLPEEVQEAYQVGYNEKAHEVTQNISDIDASSIPVKTDGRTRIEKIKSVSANNNEIVFETENGAKVPASEVEFNDRAKYLYRGENGILSLNNPTLVQLAINVESESDHGIAIANVTTPLKTMYTQGQSGLDFNSALKGLGIYTKSLSEDVLRQAYEEGKKHSNAKARATTNVKKGRGLIVEQSENNKTAYKAQFVDSKGNYSKEVQTKYENELSDTEKKFLELFSGKIGVDIRFTDDNSANRGEYKPNEGAIYLNLNNGNNMFEVALHEGIGEFLAASNEKAYNQIADSVLNAYAALNSNKLASDIRAYQNAYRNDTYGETTRGASRELFNDALGELLSTESNLKKMFDWMITNEGQTQAQKVKKTLVDYFKDIVNMIRSIRKQGGLSRLERNRMKLSEDQANKYADMIFKAMDEAIANRDAAVNKKDTHTRVANPNGFAATSETDTSDSASLSNSSLASEEKNSTDNSDIRYSLNIDGLDQYTNKEVTNLTNGGNIIIANELDEIADYVRNYVGTNLKKKIYLGKIGEELGNRIKTDTGIDLSGYNIAITNAFENSHANAKKEEARGQIAITPEIVEMVPEIIAKYDSVEKNIHKNGQIGLVFTKELDGKKTVVEYVSSNRHYIYLQTMWGQKNKTLTKRSNDIKSKLTTSETYRDMGFVDSSIAQNEENLNATDSRNKDSNTQDNEKLEQTARHSFAGIRSKTADMNAYNVAREMYDQSEDDLTIFTATGWFLGADNRWKYEIPDNDVRIFAKGNVDLLKKNNPDYARYTDLLDKVYFKGDYTVPEYIELQELDKSLPNEIKNASTREGTLSDFISHEKLFEAYPFLKDIEVEFKDLDSRLGGYTTKKASKIVLNTDLIENPVELKSTLLHETQHIIQSKEHFSNGSSATYWSKYKSEALKKDNERLHKVQQNLAKEMLRARENNEPESTKDFIEKFWEKAEDNSSSTDVSDYEAEYEEWKKGNIYHYEQQAEKLIRHIANLEIMDDHQLYRHTAGEIEAFDVQDRLDMSEAERRQKMPRLDEDNTVFAEDRMLVDRRFSKEVGDIEQAAIEHFGVTDNFKVAGYILPNGQMLDFSGKHWGGESNVRTVDHEDIFEVMEASGDNRKQFMDRGNIRLNPEAPGFNISTKVEPTSEQYRTLKEFIREVKRNPDYDAERFYVDIEDTHPNKISYANNLNEDRIINDIKRFYETGELPQQSSLNDFRYSIEVDTNGKKYVDIQDDIIAGITNDKQIKEYVKEYIKEYFPSIDMMGFDLPVTVQSRKEFTGSKYTEYLKKNLHDLFVNKMRIAGSLDELVNAADGYKWEDIKHSRSDGALGFIRGKVQIKVAGKDYIGDVVLENLGKKGLVFYDVVDLKPTTIKAASIPPRTSKTSTVENLTASKNIVTSGTQNATATSSNDDIRKSLKVDWDNERTYKMPARTYEDTIAFTGTDEEIAAAERQDIEIKAYYANIIHSKDFAGFMISWDDNGHNKSRYLTQSTRKGYDYQLSYTTDYVPVMHESYTADNDDITVIGNNFGHDMAALYEELLRQTPKEGVEVHVVREFMDDSRHSKAVFGESSQYDSTLQQTEYVSKVLSTLNNQLKGTSVSIRYIDETVDYILDKYQSNLNPEDLRNELAQFIGYMTAEDSVDYKQMMNYLMNVGDEVIQSSQLKDPESERIYGELKKELSSHKISLTEVERKELISKFGGEWKAAFGKLNSVGIKLDTKNGQRMDAGIYQEITENFRKIAGVYLDEAITPVDQIATIIDTMDALTPSAYDWDGASSMDKALDVATTIIDRYYSMASSIKESNIVKGTEKGKAAVERAKQTEIKKLRAKQAEWKGKLNEEFEALVEDRKKLIQEKQEFNLKQAEVEKRFRGEVRDFNRKKLMSERELEQTARLQAKLQYQGIKDTEAKRKHKDNIVRTSMRLINWMHKPTDARHVPTFLKPALTDMIQSINFMPASMRKGQDGTISAMKWQESMRKLQDVLKGLDPAALEAQDDSEKYNLALVMDAAELSTKMEGILRRNGGIADISRMSKEDLKELSDIMTSISKGISKMNDSFMNRRFKHITDAAKTAMDEMDNLKPYADKANVIKDLGENFLNLDMVEPITFFEEMGDASASIMQEFFDGEETGIEIIREASDFFTELKDELNLKEKDIRGWKNDTKDFNVDGGTISLSSADIMSLYCSYKRESLDQQERPYEATHHIMAGGLKGFEHKSGMTKVNRNPKVLHPTEAQVMEIINSLSETQMAYADKVVDYMSTTLAEHGNDTSNKISGYSKFLGKYYFPLKTDTNAVATTESNNETGIAGMLRMVHPSFTKSQLDKADNALVIHDFFEVVTEHITGMSNYCAYAMPLSDALRWYNYAETERNNTEVENQYVRDTRTLKGSMDRVRGKGARTYFENFLRDVNMDNSNRGGDIYSKLAQSMTGLVKAKAVGLNIRVILQQPCAIVRAADVIEGKYLTAGWAKMMSNPTKAMEYAQTNNALAFWKSQGMSDTRMTKNLEQIITGQESKLNDLVEKTGYLAGLFDDVTWAAMYYAAEEKVKATTNLNVNSEEFRKAVNELYADIINHTQVIDSQLRKTQTMRSKNAFTILANAFKKEPQKSYNMLHRAKWNQIQAKYSGDAEAINEANRKLRRSIVVFAENAFVTAIAQSLIDAWRDDEEENYLTKVLRKMIPYDAYQDVMDIITKEDHSVMDVLEIIKATWGGMGNIADNMDLLSSIPGVADIDSILKGYSVSKLDNTTVFTYASTLVTTLSSENSTTYKKLYNLAEFVGAVTGIGAGNALKDIRGFWNQFFAPRTGLYIVKNASEVKQREKAKAVQTFRDAYETDLPTAKSAMQDIYDKAIEGGKDESQAWKAVRDTLKAEYLYQIAEHPEDAAAINNRFNKLVQYTKYKKSGSDEYLNYTEAQAKKTYIDKWYDSIKD